MGKGARGTRGLVVAAVLSAAATWAALLPGSNAVAASTRVDPCAAFETTVRQPDPALGNGVTLSTSVEGNLFPSDMAPSLQVGVADPSVSGESLDLTVSDDRGPIVRHTVRLGSADSTVPLPDQPGWFKVGAQRLAGDTILGSACVWYGVAMPGAPLDLNVLPPGKDWGGPSPSRDVDLTAQLGLSVVRRQLNVAQFLTNPTTDQSLADAAAQAKQLGLRFVVQIGQGAAAETAAVKNGTWGDLVKRIVAANPTVPYWEAWNEPNTSMFFYGSAADYVNKVLAPFAQAVHAANPQAQVVGGSALGEDDMWWGKFADLGGFKLVDVIGVHPYTWQWGAPETRGMQSILEVVRSLANKNGAGNKPIFDTESGFPSAYKGTNADLWRQADYVSRKLVIERALGVASGEYELEGGWQDFSVIDFFRGVKPAAMTLSTTTASLRDRKFLGWSDTGVAGVQAARFSGVTVVWTTKNSAKLPLRCAVAGHDAYGDTVHASSSLTATGSPVFLTGDASCLTTAKQHAKKAHEPKADKPAKPTPAPKADKPANDKPAKDNGKGNQSPGTSNGSGNGGNNPTPPTKGPDKPAKG